MYDDGDRWWVVTLDVEQRSTAIVVAPPEGESGRYVEGAPLVLAAGQGIASRVGCTGQPDRLLREDTGTVLVQFLNPGQCCMDVCGGTADDVGGAVTRQAIDDLRDFALNEVHTVEGDTLASIVDLPVLDERLVVLLSSSRAAPAMAAMAANPDDYAMVQAIVQYEPPYYPAMAALELGGLLMDPNPTQDADGNGFAADDGRYPHYQIGDCTDGSCELTHVPLGWAADLAIGDVYYDVDISIRERRDRLGVLYADGNGNGQLDLEATHVDLNADGFVDSEEDFVFFGMIQDGDLEDELYWHSPELLQGAIDQGVLTEDAWPDHFPTLDQVRAFWDRIDHPAAQAHVATALPDVHWFVLAGWVDHGQVQPSRPHIVALYNDLLAAGAQPQLNPSAEALIAVDGPLPGPYEQLAQGAPVGEGDIVNHLTPENLGGPSVRTAGTLQACDLVWADLAR